MNQKKYCGCMSACLLLGCSSLASAAPAKLMVAKEVISGTEPNVLMVPHQAPAYFYPPASRKGRKPVIVWVHGRGGDPAADCRKWSHVTRDHGWLLCPSGPEDRGGSARGWNNNWTQAKSTVDAALHALKGKQGSHIQSKGHVLIGFSEGALVAMNMGVRDPDTFNRWLILAANDVYWGASGVEELKKAKPKLRKVYLLTGRKDEVVDSTKRVYETIEKSKVKVRLGTPDEIGHEVPADRMKALYSRPLRWLTASK